MNEIQISKMFEYKGKGIRTVAQCGEIWWVLTDVCNILGIANARNVSARLDDDEKGVRLIDTLGGKQKLIVVNEPGLYSILLRSDKPEAKPFKRWVTHEVLPSIRMTGQYNSDYVVEKVPTMPALPNVSVKDMLSEKKPRCDTPSNPKAQEAICEMRDLAVAVQALLKLYNRRCTEEQRKSYVEVLTDVCSKLFGKSSCLDLIEYKYS